MNRYQPPSLDPSERIPRASKAQLARLLDRYAGVRPSPFGETRNIEQTFDQLTQEIDTVYPHLNERRMGMAAAYAYAANGGPFSQNEQVIDETEFASLSEGSHFFNLYTIGYGLIRDSYTEAGIVMPPDVSQDLWFDHEPPLTTEQFFDCLNVAQIDITEKYPALQLALQSFVKSRRIQAKHPSSRATAIASIAASELFDSFTQMEAVRNS